jgi:hypothetical protein
MSQTAQSILLIVLGVIAAAGAIVAGTVAIFLWWHRDDQ